MSDSGASCMPKVEKVQKTVMIPRDLYDLAADQENVAGVPFTRIVLAALCKYFFDEPDGPNPEWMSMAVALDRGDIDIWQANSAGQAQDYLRLNDGNGNFSLDAAGPLVPAECDYTRDVSTADMNGDGTFDSQLVQNQTDDSGTGLATCTLTWNDVRGARLSDLP